MRVLCLDQKIESGCPGLGPLEFKTAWPCFAGDAHRSRTSASSVGRGHGTRKSGFDNVLAAQQFFDGLTEAVFRDVERSLLDFDAVLGRDAERVMDCGMEVGDGDLF